MVKSREIQSNSNALYFAVVLPVISGMFMAILPDWSVLNAQIIFAVVILNSLLVFGMKLTKAIEKSRKTKVIYAITQLHLFVVFLLGTVWRMWGGGLWLASLLILFNLAVAYIGYRFRRIVFQEVIQPRTRAGKIIYAVGLAGAGAAGIIGYSLTRVLSDTDPAMMPIIASVVFVPVSIYILLVIYAGWIKVEEPDWEPEPIKKRRKK